MACRLVGSESSQKEVSETEDSKAVRQTANHKSGYVSMDDETYLKLDYETLQRPQFYISPKKNDVSGSSNSIYTDKFGKKGMLWMWKNVSSIYYDRQNKW